MSKTKTARKKQAKTTRTASQPNERPVLVTSVNGGVRCVHFGYATDTKGDVITLKRARNCVRWTSDVKGCFGLAVTGPSASCRIGPAVDSIELRGVTSVSDCSVAAVAAWESAPWQK